MRRRASALITRLAHCAVLATAFVLNACDKPPARQQPATTTSAPAIASAPAAPPGRPTIDPDSSTWPSEEALKRLGAAESDDNTKFSAAVRLVRLSELHPAAVPDDLNEKAASRLRVISLGEPGWAVGRGGLESDWIASPVIIRKDGSAVSPVEGAEEEMSQLIASTDIDRFPHIILTPTRVLIVAAEDFRSAIVAKNFNGARLTFRMRDGAPVIAILWRPPASTAPASEPASQGSADPIEIASYYWDSIELAFIGPASDRIPGTGDLFFELDLEKSEALVPVGGEVKPPSAEDSQPQVQQPDVPPEF